MAAIEQVLTMAAWPRGAGRRAQQRQRGPGDADHAEHVHVEHPVPLVVVVVRHGARRADPRVVDQDVECSDGLPGFRDRRPDRGVVGHVGDDRVQAAGVLGFDPVQHGHAGAAGGQQSGGGQPDAGGAAGDQRGPARELS